MFERLVAAQHNRRHEPVSACIVECALRHDIGAKSKAESQGMRWLLHNHEAKPGLLFQFLSVMYIGLTFPVGVADRGSSCGVEHRETSRRRLVHFYRARWNLPVSRSRNPFEPFGHLDLRCALIGSTSVVDHLLRHEVVHVPARQRDLVLIFLAQDVLLGDGRRREFGQGVPDSSDPAVGKEVRDLGWTEWLVVAPWTLGGDGSGAVVAR